VDVIRISQKYNSLIDKSFVIPASKMLVGLELEIRADLQKLPCSENAVIFLENVVVPSMKLLIADAKRVLTGDYLGFKECVDQLLVQTINLAKLCAVSLKESKSRSNSASRSRSNSTSRSVTSSPLKEGMSRSVKARSVNNIPNSTLKPQPQPGPEKNLEKAESVPDRFKNTLPLTIRTEDKASLSRDTSAPAISKPLTATSPNHSHTRKAPLRDIYRNNRSRTVTAVKPQIIISPNSHTTSSGRIRKVSINEDDNSEVNHTLKCPKCNTTCNKGVTHCNICRTQL